jgi:spore germination protein GerM
VLQHVPKTPRLGSAALDALLWGPPPPNLAGFTSGIPTPEQVLGSPYREPDWGPRVTLRSLTIQNGVATADFSTELRAYESDEHLEGLAHEQIAHTLKQFSSVRQVRITIEGLTEAVVTP